MKRQNGMKRSFNYEDLASIVDWSLTIDDDHTCNFGKRRRHKRIRTCSSSKSSSSFSEDKVSDNLDKAGYPSNTHLIPFPVSRERVTITPDSSPTIQSMTESHTSSFSLNEEHPATAALNRSVISQRSSPSIDWDSSNFPLEGDKVQCGYDDCIWPTIDSCTSSPRSLEQFPARRDTVTLRTCSMRQDHRQTDDTAVGELQTAFTLLSLPSHKLEPKKSKLSSAIC